MQKDKHFSNLLITNFVYSFIAAALAVLVPLYLIDKKFDVTQIGLLLAIAPFTFMLLRVSLASLADVVGTKLIDIVCSLSSFFSILVYLFATTTMIVAVAIFGESIRTSAFFAVVRTEIIYGTNNPKGMLSFFSGVRQFADALGRVSIGFILIAFTFQNSFLLLALLSLVLLYFAMQSTHKTHKSIQAIDYNNDLLKKIVKRHPSTFWQASLLLGFVSLPSNILLGYLITIYARSSLGMDYGQIGSLLAIFSFVVAAASFLSIKWKLDISLLLLMLSLTIPFLLFFPYFGQFIFIPIIFVAIGIGCGNILYEYILLDQIYRSKSVSTDIGILNSPLKVMEFVFLSTSGFIIAQFGYWPLFALLSLCSILFVIFSRAFLRR
jgi:MFS family permease